MNRNRYADIIKEIKTSGLYPNIKLIDKGASEPVITISNNEYLNFCSNNYLGLSAHPEVVKNVLNTAKEFGIGPGTSRLLCGNLELYERLENKVANLVQTKASIVVPTGYIANIGIISALLDEPDFLSYKSEQKSYGVVLSDQYNHASVIDGCKQSYAKVTIFKHNDIFDLHTKVSAINIDKPKLIVTEGVFSLEAEVAPLKDISAIAKKYNAMLLIDDAHSIGVLGQFGGGTVQHLGLTGQVDIIMGSFSKALGGMGGFIAGSQDLIDFLRIALRPYIYSSPISAPIAAGLIKAIDLCVEKNDLREKLFSNYRFLYEELNLLGHKVLGDGQSPVLPIMIYDEKRAIEVSKKLFNHGILLECFRPPAVPPNTARLRIVPMATHKKEHLEKLLQALSIIL